MQLVGSGILGRSNVESPSYIIDPANLSKILLFDRTGQQINIGNDFSTLFGQAVGLLGTVGGWIHIKRSPIPVPVTAPVPLPVCNNLRITGEGPQCTTLTLPNGANANMFQYTSGSPAYFFQIENICLQGNGANQTTGNIIDLNVNLHDVRISNCFISSAWGDGIKCYADGTCIHDNAIEYCGIYGGASYYGVEIPTGYHADLINNKIMDNEGGVIISASNSRLIGNYIRSNTHYGVRIFDPATDIEIIGNDFVGNSNGFIGTYDQLYIQTASGINRIKVIGNSFDGFYNAANQSKYGVEMNDGLVYDCLIANNSFVNHTSASIQDLSSRARIINNIGYNPLGSIATPWPAGAGVLADVAAAQNNPSTATLYTVWGSPKLIILTNCAGISQVQIDGVTLANTTTASPQTYLLQPGQTIKVTWTVTTPNGQVFAQ